MNKFAAIISNRLKALPESRMLLILSFVTGLCSGVASLLIKNAIHFFAWILKGWFNTPAESILYILYPGVGMLLSLLFVKYVIKDNISHGVTKVLHSIARNESRIKSHNTWSSIAASSVTIGFGGSVGAEAPIVYTGAAIGSNLARSLGLSYKYMTILLGCGAAGAIAGIFKAPLAGLLFTLEILMFNISMTSIVPLLVSTVTAATVSFFFLGDAVVFSNTLETFKMSNIPYYIGLGVACGFISLYFTRTTLRIEDKIGSISNPYKKWFISAASLGILIFLFPPLYGEGYSSITALLNNNPSLATGSFIFNDLLRHEWFIPLFFLAIVFLKIVAMAFTNAGGGVGGTFGPTLVVGGIFGFVFSRVLNLTGIDSIPETNFALVGMAGLMAGVMHAPMTAIFLIAEMTGGYMLLTPLIITSVVSFATIRGFEKYSIYTKRIAREGDLLTHDNDKAALTLLKTCDLIEKDFTPVKEDYTLGMLTGVIASSRRNLFPVTADNGTLQGIILLDEIRTLIFEREKYDTVKVKDIMKQPPGTVCIEDSMEQVMNKFEITSVWNLPVLDKNGAYIGFISKSKIFSAYREQLKLVSHE
ncbi:MAG: chloride channel protein [Bacteroidales bacterium]|nr:chloride channel protein [Bacteroidales bacterium]MDD2425329.1 chloride channel protein [Bacteroidales bacterium]MDD3989391.1 chloride channel protein [Bacteroidales bacterium]